MLFALQKMIDDSDAAKISINQNSLFSIHKQNENKTSENHIIKEKNGDRFKIGSIESNKSKEESKNRLNQPTRENKSPSQAVDREKNQQSSNDINPNTPISIRSSPKSILKGSVSTSQIQENRDVTFVPYPFNPNFYPQTFSSLKYASNLSLPYPPDNFTNSPTNSPYNMYPSPNSLMRNFHSISDINHRTSPTMQSNETLASCNNNGKQKRRRRSRGSQNKKKDDVTQ